MSMYPRIALLIVTDGRRDYLERTMESFYHHCWHAFAARIVVNDSLDPAYRAYLDDRFWGHTILHPTEKRGFCGAIQAGWAAIPPDVDLVYHLEEDFVFNRDVDLRAMVQVLTEHPYLAQLALKRQPWNDEEKAAGDMLKRFPGAFTQMSDGEHKWLEHQQWFTTNPSLYPRWVADRAWPNPPECEGRFTHAFIRDVPIVRFGYWGELDDEPWVTHIGEERAGHGY